MDAGSILEQANQRIQQHRTADLVVKVVDSTGKPLPGAQVDVHQTRHDFLFGSNIFRWGRGSDEETTRYEERFETLFNYATFPFYWRRFEPEQGKGNHDYIAKVLDWCLARNITCKGHPLIWNHDASSPEWLPDKPESIFAMCEARVRNEVSGYSGKINFWDVTNEAADCFRNNSVDKKAYQGAVSKAWKAYGKVPFARHFFFTARQANPNATLLINDYRTDGAYVELIKGLIDDHGKPVYDAIGIQSHMHGNYWGVQKTWETCERFAQFGKPLHFTETTLISGQPRSGKKIDWWGQSEDWHSTLSGEKRQARNVEEFYTLLFSHPAVSAVSWFDLVDYGWLGAPGGLIRPDRHPKPAYLRLQRLIKGHWWTQITTETKAKGSCRVRAFYGNYTIKAKLGNAEKTAEFHHTKGGEYTVTLTI